MDKDELIAKTADASVGFVWPAEAERIAKEAARLAYEDAAETVGSTEWREDSVKALRAKAAALKE